MRNPNKRLVRFIGHIEKLEDRCLMAAGDRDLSFSGDGYLTTDLQPSETRGREFVETIVQPDGKILALAERAIVRLLPNGNLDLQFGASGKVALPFTAVDMVLQANGRIGVVGNTEQHIGVARYLTNGSADVSFSGDGLIETLFNGRNEFMRAIVERNNQLLTVGQVTGNGPSGVGVMRFTANGNLDRSFGVGGTIVHSFDDGSSPFEAVVQADGKLVIVGSSGLGDAAPGSNIMIARLTTTGSLDTTFSNDGWNTIATTSDSNWATDAAIQSNGRIVIAGAQDNRAFLYRFTINGSLDTTFQPASNLLNALPFQTTETAHLSLGEQDRVLLAAGVNNVGLAQFMSDGAADPTFGTNGLATIANANADSVSKFSSGHYFVGGTRLRRIAPNGPLLAKFSTNGLPDATFGNGGFSTTTLGPSHDVLVATTTLANGSTIAVGKSNQSMVIVKYNPSGAIDNNFGNQGRVLFDLPGDDIAISANAIAIQSNGRIVVAGNVTDFAADGSLMNRTVLLRLLSNGALDPSFSGDGWLVSPADDARPSSVAIDPSGKIVVGVNSFGAASIYRFNSNGTVDTRFANAGVRRFAVPNTFVNRTKVMLHASGTITAVALLGDRILIGRVTSNGALDASLNGRGSIVVRNSNLRSVNDAVIDNQNAIYVIGNNRSTTLMNVLKLNASGQTDASFGAQGVASVSFNSRSIALAISLDSSNRIVLGGLVSGNYALAWLTAGGQLDTSFSSDGILVDPTPTSAIRTNITLSITSNDKIVVGGTLVGFDLTTVLSDFELLRFLG